MADQEEADQVLKGLSPRFRAMYSRIGRPSIPPERLLKGYDTRKFVGELHRRGITPHVTENITHHGGSAIDGRTTRRAGYDISQRLRKRVEEIFDWGQDRWRNAPAAGSKAENERSCMP